MRFMCDNEIRKHVFLHLVVFLAVRCCRVSLEGTAYPCGGHVGLILSLLVIWNGEILSILL